MSRLQAELNTIKLQEYEAQEQIADLTAELEKEHRARERTDHELKVRNLYVYSISVLYVHSSFCISFKRPVFELNALPRYKV